MKKTPAKGSRKTGAYKRISQVTQAEFDRLTDDLRESNETLDAIRKGDVDAVVVNGPSGSQIYSLSGAEQPYRVYVERMQEGAATLSSEGLILYSNQRFADMVYQPLEKVIGSTASTYLTAAAWQEIYGVFESQQEVAKCESVLHRSGEPSLPVNLTASLLPNEGQNVVCLVVTDLSTQKLHQEMRLAKEVAEKANLAKDAFLATLSHELRTPLNPALLIASDAAENTDLSDAVRADFATICNKIELEARLIDDLLDVTRITNGKLILTLEVIDALPVLHYAIETVKADIISKNITFTLDVEKQPCCVKADAVRLQQAFWNVLSNAVKFTPPDGEVRVVARAVAQNHQFIVTVTDDGMGITREEMEQIFEAFVQGDHAKKFGSYQFGGLGLGLPICRKIIKLHAGDIKVSSDGRGKGSTFVIELPLCETPEPSGNGKPGCKAPAAAVGKGIRILLVEDHEPTRLALTHLLSRRNHRVSPAGSLEEAHSLAKKNRFELVISDIGLPDGSGFELMKELKQQYQLKGIALTGYGMEQDILLSENSGFATHLTKPVRMESLENALARVMQSNDLL